MGRTAVVPEFNRACELWDCDRLTEAHQAFLALAQKGDVGSQLNEITDLGPSQIATRTFRVTRDSHYTIAVLFQSGKRLEHEDGYLTPGFDFDDRITVTESEMAGQSTHRDPYETQR